METDVNGTAARFGSDPESSTSAGANGLAAVSLACGIASFFAVGVILGPVAIATGAVAIRRSAGQGRRGMAIVGLVTGVPGMLVSTVVLSALTVVILADRASTELAEEVCAIEYETVQTAIEVAKAGDDGARPQDFLASTPKYFVIQPSGADWQVIPKGDLPAGCP